MGGNVGDSLRNFYNEGHTDANGYPGGATILLHLQPAPFLHVLHVSK